MADSSDQILIKIAVFGIAMSFMCSMMIGLLITDSASGDYSYDEVTSYRNELISYSGQSMINENPWVLTHVYTPWAVEYGYNSAHLDESQFLFGTEITNYAGLNQVVAIKLDPDQKSAVPLSYDASDSVSFSEANGYQWWAGNAGIRGIAQALGFDVNTYQNYTTNTWQFTGYRYVFDPTLPFTSTSGTTTSTVDGSLSIVWYNYNGAEGLSGGLVIYGGDVLIANYSATDIIADYNSYSGYASTYKFDFNGTVLTLSIRFNAEEIEAGTDLMEAWTAGDWDMAISSKSAGNFFDLDNSTAFTTTAGSMIDTFIQIYTFSCPSIDNPMMDLVLWLLVGLPMTIAMLCITLRIMDSVKIIG